MVKLGWLLGSLLTQWQHNVQEQLEVALHNRVGKYIKLDIQLRQPKYKNKKGKQNSTAILHVQVNIEDKEAANTGLRELLGKNRISPVGRKMQFIPADNRSNGGRVLMERMLQIQRNTNKNERTAVSVVINDIKR